MKRHVWESAVVATEEHLQEPSRGSAQSEPSSMECGLVLHPNTGGLQLGGRTFMKNCPSSVSIIEDAYGGF